MATNEPDSADFEVYCSHLDILGEGPLWSIHRQALFWLDIGSKALFGQAPSESSAKLWPLPDHPGCLGDIAGGHVAIAMGAGVQRLRLDSGETDFLYTAPGKREGTRFNDGKVDPRGRLWVGTMQNNFGRNGESIRVDRSMGALYRFDLDAGACLVEEPVGIPNMLAWSPDLKRFYWADSLRGEIWLYDFDADTGAVCNKRLFFHSSQYGVPDGSAVDVEGCLWNARWDAGVILQITPDARVNRVIPLPVPRPTSCAFGGSGLDTLFVTSARIGLTDLQLAQSPLSGSVLAIQGLAQGMPVPPLNVIRS